MGGEAGQATLERIEHTFGRMEAIWKPVGSEEGFEVVRRRLFLPLEDEPARDNVCRAFSALYRDGDGEFPSECREARYLERLKACYPIHPELFDRLYADWSTLERFQRTRGVLRLMAAVIHDLWSRSDAGLLVMPGSVGLDAVNVREELIRYLPEGWTSVVESDIDGRNSGPWRVDGENPRFGQAMAGRRVARAVFLGSAPHVVPAAGARGRRCAGAARDRAAGRAGCPCSTTPYPGFSDRLIYLYRKDRRYWYDTRPNLRRTVEERALQFPQEEVDAEIAQRVRRAARHGRGDFRGVHVCPAESADVPDEQRVRLVVIRPTATHKRGLQDTAALAAAAEILENRGAAPRQHRNMLVFLAADGEAMEGLAREVRRFLAWRSVERDKDALNLDANQRREATEGRSTSDGSVEVRFAEAWRWLLVPTLPLSEGNLGDLEWEAIQAQGDDASIIARAAKRLRTNDTMIPNWSPALLKMELDRWFWNERDQVSTKAVWDALSAYCYLPRLLDESVFVEAVRAGVASGDYFGFATSVSSEGRYEGLKLGEDSGGACGYGQRTGKAGRRTPANGEQAAT